MPAIAAPAHVMALLEMLWAAGHAGYIVGGSLRDLRIGREPADWDLATDARPDRILEVVPGSAYENRFGTVAIRTGGTVVEITTFRSDHEYADFRRPHRVEFGDRIELDLARRDFTVNAMAWGADAPRPDAPGWAPGLVDPFGGAADADARIIRAVGDARIRFEEDTLRMLRAVRLAATLGFAIEPATLAAIEDRAPLAVHLSGERIAAELDGLLGATRPSIGLGLLAQTGLLVVILPELAAQIGLPQAKIPGDDLWAHTLRTVDAVPANRPVVRLAALLHDVGKPATMADGHFHDHDTVGAGIATAILTRLRMPRAVIDRVGHLVRQHMFAYGSSWGDAGVRRFIRRVGESALDELFALREADNVGSGLAPDADDLPDLRRRVTEQLEAAVALEHRDLAIDGDDLIAELGMAPGPGLGRILDDLLERVIVDPTLNDRPTLLLLAAARLADEP